MGKVKILEKYLTKIKMMMMMRRIRCMVVRALHSFLLEISL